VSKAKQTGGILDEVIDMFDSVADVVNGDVFDGILEETPAAPKVDVSNEREDDNTEPVKPVKPVKPGSTFKPTAKPVKPAAEPEPEPADPA